MNIEDKFKIGIELIDEMKLMEAKNIFKELIIENTSSEHWYKFNFMLGGIYQKLNSPIEAINSYNACLKVRPEMEIASLGKYICLVTLERYDDALEEIVSFLSKYPANDYLVTLEELNEDIRDGCLNNGKNINKIKSLIEKYKIE